jgi:hypothetical protein
MALQPGEIVWAISYDKRVQLDFWVYFKSTYVMCPDKNDSPLEM